MSKLEVDTIDTKTGTNSLTIKQNDTAAITIDTSQNVGIGTSSPTFSTGTGVHVNSSTSDARIHLTNSVTGTTSGDGAYIFSGSDSAFGLLQAENADMRLYTNATERMAINGNGRALFSTTGTNTVVNSAWKYQMRFDGGSDAGLYMSAEANANGTGYLGFHRSTSTEIGSVTRNGTADQVNYNTSSDYRMKENVIDLSDATTRVKQLQPKRFSWISQESDTATQDGFIAHEVQSIVPEAVTGTHNEVQVWKEGEELPEGVSVGDNKLDDEGNTIPKYQGIDQSKLVPLLTASLKEAIAKIEELETRIATLENA